MVPNMGLDTVDIVAYSPCRSLFRSIIYCTVHLFSRRADKMRFIENISIFGNSKWRKGNGNGRDQNTIHRYTFPIFPIFIQKFNFNIKVLSEHQSAKYPLCKFETNLIQECEKTTFKIMRCIFWLINYSIKWVKTLGLT